KHIYELFELVEDGYASLPATSKMSFRFDDRADGFLPQGQEYAENSPDKPDLCERFCYWYRHRQEHREYDIHSTRFYRGISRYEAEISDLGQRILDEVARHYSQPTIPVGRLDSYVQLCIYEAHHRRADRIFLQEPHVDGHLLTFISNTSQGLALNSGN
ncbi:2OG-Fe(II) oxygenase, partial [Pseudomonas sp. MWU13-2625]